MKNTRIRVTTSNRPAIADLTGTVTEFVKGEGDGLVSISVPHATAGLVIMELGSGSEQDLWDRLAVLLPPDGRYKHQHGSPDHGRDHLLPAFLAPALTLPVFGGRVSLGTWQSIALVDPNVDNPEREVVLAFLRSAGDT